MTTMQKTLITTAIVTAVGTGVYEAYQKSQLQKELQQMAAEQKPLVEENQKLRRKWNETADQLAKAQEEIEQLRRQTAEIHKVRGEVARLRQDARGLISAEPIVKAWLSQIALLKQKLEQMPDKKIPELQFVTEKDWANAAWDADLNTEDGVRQALSKLREEAQNIFLNLMRTAIQKYTKANDGTLPTDLLQLKPYFETPINDAVFQHYKLLQTGKLSSDRSKPLVETVAYADEEYDSWHQMSLGGAGGGGFNRVREAIEVAARAFAKDNNGQLPSEPSSIESYLKKPADVATVQKYLNKMATDDASQFMPSDIRTALAILDPALEAYSAANNGKGPSDSSQLLPYLTTPEQQAALQKLINAEKDVNESDAK